MNWHTLIIIGIAVGLTGCTKKQEAEPVADEPPATAGDMVEPEPEDWRNEELLAHMHEHADHLDALNFALADDDLIGAMTPAYWLSRHDTDGSFPARFQPYVQGMREAAVAVEAASDVEEARAAAERITVQCQGCHEAAGVNDAG